ncbi:MAG: thioesterase family protein [Myxococcales bacterium]|nr:thioesterase family protein [Myxococcales bacterium]
MTVLPPLTDILDLETVEEGVFLGPPVDDGRPRVFGGQVLAQALAAASFTVEDGWPCHSLHSYFLRPGKPGRPVYYEVTDLRNAKRFCSRQVLAIQRDEPILQFTASFQSDDGQSESVQLTAPDAPHPNELPDEETTRDRMRARMPEHARDRFNTTWPIEIRPTDDSQWFEGKAQPAERRVWFRCRDQLPDYPNLHRCALTYSSDMFALQSCVMATSMSPFDPDLQMASLDHSVWFHRELRADAWLLFAGKCVSVANGRGLASGHVFSEGGELVATIAQEGLMHLASSGSE